MKLNKTPIFMILLLLAIILVTACVPTTTPPGPEPTNVPEPTTVPTANPGDPSVWWVQEWSDDYIRTAVFPVYDKGNGKWGIDFGVSQEDRGFVVDGSWVVYKCGNAEKFECVTEITGLEPPSAGFDPDAQLFVCIGNGDSKGFCGFLNQKDLKSSGANLINDATGEIYVND